ncbi:DUF3828 domain-containing protein (plasmid) [Hymenobacter sp. NBH84]|uniref:DUF3828 domain-containing protein n=1 Tax=Hymenobacter sp. NBH84 TaxID=2596915 RepID=UPI00162A276B|nr:DUF3828 domain-containing protein [Hymenobacter sp. NBH84]QNE41929.1 DUF3828 domain-containing protein [Hymenobacter sp. NBH84]
MKLSCYTYWLSLLLLAACTTDSTTSTPAQMPPSATRAQQAVASPPQTVVAFLRWYQQRHEQLNTMPTVPAANDADTTNPYAVDFQAVDRYLQLLQRSGRVAPTYLLTQRRYFQYAQDSLQAHPQTDGPPSGLDYDRVLFTQDAEGQVALLLRSQPTQVSMSQDSAQVLYRWQESEMSEGPNLTFSLVRHNGQWLINAIRPTQ